jgi:Tfp pilus assembly protein PilO
MTEQWKLPKHVRTMIQQRKDQLRSTIRSRKEEISRLENWRENLVYLIGKDEQTLGQLERDYPSDEED